MSSIEELKIVRLYRAYNTIIQMCMDHGCSVRHPSVVAQAIRDPQFYSDEDGLDYDWFQRHFVVQQAPGAVDDEEEEQREVQARRGSQHQQQQQRWCAMRGAMRLVCSTSGDDATGDSSEKGRPLLVFFSASPSLSMGEVQEYRDKALQKGACRMIVVVAGKISHVVRRGTRELSGRLRVGTTEEVMSIQLFEEDALACNIARHETVPPHVALSPAEAQAFLQSRKLTLSQLPRILDEDPMVAYLGLSRGSIVRIQRETKESGPYEMYRQVI
ncbi:DNA-directed RNA polymerase II [Trypanosoma grayi]|uniref:DNA-directed RNA polymerase II n=1 Tax=Trypanosoma grayi TaxID=71804 RepID=UPI0004F45A4B|nr:DNA-directed RNA polymerase II [Trypanosoma grayi]KEG15176.1 DNA-directed RNA polymerase II [Trypanosoma grayi]